MDEWEKIKVIADMVDVVVKDKVGFVIQLCHKDGLTAQQMYDIINDTVVAAQWPDLVAMLQAPEHGPSA